MDISQPPAPDPVIGSGWAPEKGQTTLNLEWEGKRTNEERYVSQSADNPESWKSGASNFEKKKNLGRREDKYEDNLQQ